MVKSTEWVTGIPEIKEEHKESFLGWFIQGTDKKVSNYDFVGGDITLEPRFDITKNAPAGLYKNGKLTMTWDTLVSREYIGIKETSIKECSFRSYLDGDLVIANTVQKIESSAFMDCSKLTSIVIPNSVTSISNQAFYNCSSLNNIIIPSSVTNIEDNTFGYCENLTSVILEDGVQKIGERAFENCTKLENIYLSNTLIEIGEEAFKGCTSLHSVDLPNTKLTIGKSAFEGCSAIEILTIPENTKSIDVYAFDNMSNLRQINFNAKYIDDYLSSSNYFNSMGSNTTGVEINIGQYVRSIPAGLFCQKDTNSIPVTVNFAEDSKLINISYLSFVGCNISELVLPNSLTTIGDRAFSDNTNLTKVVMPKSVNKIGTDIFDSEQVNIYYLGTEEEWNSINLSTNTAITEDNLYFYKKPDGVNDKHYWYIRSEIDYKFETIYTWGKKSS